MTTFFEEFTRLGLAYSGYTGAFLADYPGTIDYVEIPFELVHYKQEPLDIPHGVPTVLHCASLSLAGSVPPTDDIIRSVTNWTWRSETPWLGEHLAFVTAQAVPSLDGAERLPYDVGYSINPPTNTETAQRVVRSVDSYRERIGVPILLENAPVYFEPPGSTMTPTEFTQLICAGSSARLLVDLAHLYITCHNLGQDPLYELLSLPTDRIDEVHISGLTERDGAWWDDHTVAAPDAVHELLRILLQRTRIAAITLEYNWSGSFPVAVVMEEVDKVRRLLARTRGLA